MVVMFFGTGKILEGLWVVERATKLFFEPLFICCISFRNFKPSSIDR